MEGNRNSEHEQTVHCGTESELKEPAAQKAPNKFNEGFRVGYFCGRKDEADKQRSAMENECAKAYELGWNDGYAEGYDDAEEDIKEGVTPDVYFVDGEEGISEEDYLEAINDSFDDGFDEGYSAGYAEGYMKAKKEEKHNG